MSYQKILFISWTPDTKGSQRTKILSSYLNSDIFRFPLFTRNILLSPIKFPIQIIITLIYLFKKKPEILLVEFTQPFIGLTSILYKKIFKKITIIDFHSGPLVSKQWKNLQSLTYFVLKRSDLIIIHEKTIIKKLKFLKDKKFIIIHDPPLNFKDIPVFYKERKYFVFPSSGGEDEPLEELIESAKFFHELDFYITGKHKKKFLNVPQNVKFTGLLSFKEFYSLLKGSKGIIALTKWENTLLSAGFEALNLEKPLIVSNKRALREFFKENVIYVNNNPDSIKKGIEKLLENYDYYTQKIKNFKKDYIKRFEGEIENLKKILSSFNKTS